MFPCKKSQRCEVLDVVVLRGYLVVMQSWKGRAPVVKVTPLESVHAKTYKAPRTTNFFSLLRSMRSSHQYLYQKQFTLSIFIISRLVFMVCLQDTIVQVHLRQPIVEEATAGLSSALPTVILNINKGRKSFIPAPTIDTNYHASLPGLPNFTEPVGIQLPDT